MMTPQEALQDYLSGITQARESAELNKCKDLAEIRRIEKTFICAVNFLDVMLDKKITYRSFKIKTP